MSSQDADIYRLIEADCVECESLTTKTGSCGRTLRSCDFSTNQVSDVIAEWKAHVLARASALMQERRTVLALN